MQQDEFIEIMTELILRDTPLAMSDQLKDIEEWDSMSMMALIAYFDTILQTRVTFEQLEKAQTVADVAAFVPGIDA